MSWVRLDDQIGRHPKMLAAGPAACWLWVCALAYSQSLLTDGFISLEALPLTGVTKGAEKLAAKLVQAGLFDVVSGGWQIHDYHHHNSTRAEVLLRRAEDSSRKRRPDSGRIPSGFPRPLPDVPSHPIPSHPIPVSAQAALTTELGDRVRAFIEGYGQLYSTHRNGAHYHGRPSVDYQQACDLCQTWPDTERLLKLAAVFLTSDDEWIAKGNRSIPQFAARASWCDDRLREWEKAQGQS